MPNIFIFQILLFKILVIPSSQCHLQTSYSFIQIVIEIIFLMFRTLNPYALPLIFRPVVSNAEVQKLCRYFGLALQRSIQAFKQKRNVQEKQTIASQRTLCLTKTSQSQDKNEKSEIQIQAVQEERKKNTKNVQQLENKKIENHEKIGQKFDKNEVLKPKRRIIRKINGKKQKARTKKLQKKAKQMTIIRADLKSSMAKIEGLKHWSSRQIARRKQNLYRRYVKVWQVEEANTQRRKRIQKHTQ